MLLSFFFPRPFRPLSLLDSCFYFSSLGLDLLVWFLAGPLWFCSHLEFFFSFFFPSCRSFSEVYQLYLQVLVFNPAPEESGGRVESGCLACLTGQSGRGGGNRAWCRRGSLRDVHR